MDVAGRAFEQWYLNAYPRLSVSVLALTGDRDAAADVTDEAFARAWRHWRRVGEMDSPEGWVYRVALNLVRSRSRRRKVERRALAQFTARPDVAAPAGEVWALVRDLPERQRQAIVLRFVADLDELEIAQVMGVTRGTVASTLFDARHRLAAILDEPDGEPERERPAVIEERS